MPHFAQIDPHTNIVHRVIVAATQEWCEDHLGGMWRRTYYNTPGHVYAGIGFTFDPTTGNYRPPRPYPSWTFDNATWQWQAPSPAPSEEYLWDEPTLSWVKPTIEEETV